MAIDKIKGVTVRHCRRQAEKLAESKRGFFFRPGRHNQAGEKLLSNADRDRSYL